METYRVKLDHCHPGYQSLELKRRHPMSSDYVVIHVGTGRLLELCSRDGDYFLPPVPQWTQSERYRLHTFLDSREPGVAEMPVVSIYFRTVSRWGWRPPFRSNIEEPVLAFTNGRHRALYLAYAGAQTIPVEATARSAPLVKEYCGSVPLD